MYHKKKPQHWYRKVLKKKERKKYNIESTVYPSGDYIPEWGHR